MPLQSLSTAFRTYPLSWFLCPVGDRGYESARYRGRDAEGDVMVYIPGHQRDYVWNMDKQKGLIRSVFLGYPIPAIFVTQDHRNRYSLQEGQQRMETFYRYYTNRFPYNGKLYRDLTEAEQDVFMKYVIPVIDISGATIDQESEIYDLVNQGVALSHGEKFHNRRTKPLVALAMSELLTPGAGLCDAATEVWGDYTSGKDPRHARLANAVGLIAGAAYGPEYISTSYTKLADHLDGRRIPNGVIEAIDGEKVRHRLGELIAVYRDVDAAQAIPMKKKKAQWKLGLYSAYILYSIIYCEEHPEEKEEVMGRWREFLVKVRLTPSYAAQLYRNMGGNKNITMDRLERGFKNLMEEGDADEEEVDEDEDD